MNINNYDNNTNMIMKAMNIIIILLIIVLIIKIINDDHLQYTPREEFGIVERSKK